MFNMKHFTVNVSMSDICTPINIKKAHNYTIKTKQADLRKVQ